MKLKLVRSFKADIIRQIAKSPLKKLLKPFARQIDDISVLSQYSDESFLAPSKYLQTLLHIQQAARIYGKETRDLSFGAPIFSDTWNQKVLQLLQEVPYRDSHLTYPSAGGYWALRSTLLKTFESSWQEASQPFTAEQILITNGANQLINLVFDAFTSPKDGVIFFDPSYMLYAFQARMKSLKICSIQSNIDDLGFLHFSKEEFEKASLKSKIAFINSPSNPTGAVLRDEDFHFIRDVCKKRNILLIRDEVYDEYHKNPENRFAKYPPASNEIILKSFSKSFGFAGLRIGYAIARDEYIKIMRLHQACTVPFVSSISQTIAEALLHDKFLNDAQEERTKTLSYVQKASEQLHAHQKKHPSSTSGIYIWYPSGNLSAEEFCLRIAQDLGIILMPGESFGSSGKKYVRISIRNEDSLKALDQVINFSKSLL